MLKKAIAVVTSGGDSPGMNAAARAVVRTALYEGVDVYGVHNGYSGMVHDDIEQLTSRSVSDLIQRGGTFLGTARSKTFMTPEGRKTAYENLRKRNIEGLVIIGGDGPPGYIHWPYALSCARALAGLALAGPVLTERSLLFAHLSELVVTRAALGVSLSSLSHGLCLQGSNLAVVDAALLLVSKNVLLVHGLFRASGTFGAGSALAAFSAGGVVTGGGVLVLILSAVGVSVPSVTGPLSGAGNGGVARLSLSQSILNAAGCGGQRV